MYTDTVDIFVVGVGKRAITQSGLHQILVVLAENVVSIEDYRLSFENVVH